MQKKFLLIEHGGPRKKFTIEKLLDKDLDVYIACTDTPKFILDLIPESKIIITDTYNSVSLLASVVSYMLVNHFEFSAVGTFHEHNVCQTADIAAALALPGIDPSAARRSSSNKALMRHICQKAGILTPKFTIIRNLTEKSLESALTDLKNDCVLKPIFGAESYGVIKVNQDSDLRSVLSEVNESTQQDKKETFKNFAGAFILEEYLSGKVVSVDGIVQNSEPQILGMVEFLMGPEPRFTQEGNYIPPRISADLQAMCHKELRKIITALGFNNCGFHCEMRLTPKGPVLIEIAARLPGGPLQPGYRQATGIDLTDALIDVWLGQTIKITPMIRRNVLQKAIFDHQAGTLTAMTGIEALKDIEGVWEYAQITQINSANITYPDIPSPIYYYAAVADSAEELATIEKKVESTVRYIIKPTT